MVDLIAQSLAQLRQAQRSDLSLPLRLRAISAMAQAIDCFCQGGANGSTSAALAGERLPAPEHMVANELNAAVLDQLQAATQLVVNQLIPLLRRQHILLPAVEQLGEQQRDWLFDYFKRRIHPLLTPLAVDPGHPFPYISNESLNLLVLLQRPGGLASRILYARVKVPRQVVPRLIEVPPLVEVDSPVLNHDADYRYWVWSEEVVRFFVDELFAGMSVKGIYQFRVLRANAAGEGEEQPELATGRDKTAPVVHVDVQQNMPPAVLSWLIARLDIPSSAVYRCATPLGMANWDDVAARLETVAQRRHRR